MKTILIPFIFLINISFAKSCTEECTKFEQCNYENLCECIPEHKTVNQSEICQYSFDDCQAYCRNLEGNLSCGSNSFYKLNEETETQCSGPGTSKAILIVSFVCLAIALITCSFVCSYTITTMILDLD